MREESFEFLKAIVEVPSPSGFEQPAQRVVRERMRPIADDIRTDVHGNVIAALQPEGHPRIMLAGHCDQIGMMVRYITDEGYIHFASIGGIDASVLPGARLTVHTAKGPVTGVVGRKAVHLMSPEERGKGKIQIKDLWLDIGARNRKAAERQVSVGDPMTFALGMEVLQKDVVASPGFDDKIGSFVVMETLRLLKRRKFSGAVFAVSTVQEELGLRGARTSCFGLDPQVGIAVDVTHASDYPGADKKVSGDLSLGKGPVVEVGPNINPMVGKLLLDTAKAKKIPHQICGAPGATGTDANAMQISRAGVAAGLVSVPNRYMHTPVEIVHLRDLENAAKLLAEVICKIGPDTDFIPQ
ncbi:MAG: M42 family metallopeptidase [Armatimonadota bacterium]